MIVEGDLPARTMEQPKISINESSQKEKQIVESSIKHGFFETAALAAIELHSPSLRPPKPKFLSLSLPNSANSSPLFTSTLMRKKSKSGGSIESPSHASNLILKHQDLLQKIRLRRSKSFAEGRAFAPSDEFDLWLAKSSAVEHNMHHESFSKTEEAIKESHVNCNDLETLEDEGFKCSALCLYLPGFAKAKPVKARKQGLEVEAVISRTVSLEKFECGIWSSSVLFHEIEGDPMNSFFDLPMELIKCSANDVHAPVTSAFVFEKDLKGVLKNGSPRACARKSDTSPHCVRFSTSSSTSHPSLRKTREDFNAFLEAQTA